ncbi:MAG: hypothetical protein PF572_01355 [Patescibacteria group bacterium]|jgi:hypothetical protein|nr:hypothetical protein [Patescibacteria group bacterium]
MENNNEKQKNLRGAIVETIAFFDLFSFPLTVNEVLKYLKLKSNYVDVSDKLQVLVEKKIVERKGGLFYLYGKEEYVQERKKRYNYSDRKLKIALKMTTLFRFIPWIRLICVANLIGRDNLRDKSDIDLFIVSDKNRLWLTRFFAVMLAKLLNVRPQKNDTKDKICLSFFVSVEQMDMSLVRKGENDIYFNYWFLNLAPIYSRGNSFTEFIESNKKIIDEFPNYFTQDISAKRKIKEFNNNFYKRNWEVLFGGLEKTIKKLQLKIMPENLLRLIPEKKGVIVSDKIIKLHLEDKREEFLKKYNESISKITI